MEVNIYEVEEKEDKNGNPFLLLDTDLGSVWCFPNDFEGDFERVKKLDGKKIEGGVTAGDYPKLRVFEAILGSAKPRPKKKDKDRIISRIACVNSAIKMIEAGAESPTQSKMPTMVFNTAEEIFKFIRK